MQPVEFVNRHLFPIVIGGSVVYEIARTLLNCRKQRRKLFREGLAPSPYSYEIESTRPVPPALWALLSATLVAWAIVRNLPQRYPNAHLAAAIRDPGLIGLLVAFFWAPKMHTHAYRERVAEDFPRPVPPFPPFYKAGARQLARYLIPAFCGPTLLLALLAIIQYLATSQ